MDHRAAVTALPLGYFARRENKEQEGEMPPPNTKPRRRHSCSTEREHLRAPVEALLSSIFAVRMTTKKSVAAKLNRLSFPPKPPHLNLSRKSP
nr:hypothetical protein Itr_chr08CG18490 [Ipomoea trifida]